jgi:hypothetical protein
MDDCHAARRWQEKAAVAIDEYSISFRLFYIDENTSHLTGNTDLWTETSQNLYYHVAALVRQKMPDAVASQSGVWP